MSIVTAHSAMDFLTASSGLDAISSKYSRGLSEQYDLIHPGIIESVAEGKLRTLAEIEAAENAVTILNAYIFRVYKYYPDNRPRKMTGLFTSEFKGSRTPIPEHQELTKAFKAFIFSIRSNVYNYAPSGWSIIEEPEVGWLGELVAEPSSIFDSF
mgnify:FL=1